MPDSAGLEAGVETDRGTAGMTVALGDDDDVASGAMPVQPRRIAAAKATHAQGTKGRLPATSLPDSDD